MRLFIAIQLPKEVQENIAEIQKKFAGKGQLNFVKESHLTLKFLGEVNSTLEKKIEQKLSKINFQNFSLTFSGTGFFPDEKNARVFWIGLQLCEQINELKNEIDRALSLLFKMEQNFVPHITIARIKSIKDATGFQKAVENTKIKPIKIQANSFCLVQSKLEKEGPKYKVIREFFAN